MTKPKTKTKTTAAAFAAATAATIARLTPEQLLKKEFVDCQRQSRQHRSETTYTSYDGKELRDNCHRPGAKAATVAPSRQGDNLHYLDGRIINQPLPAKKLKTVYLAEAA